MIIYIFCGAFICCILVDYAMFKALKHPIQCHYYLKIFTNYVNKEEQLKYESAHMHTKYKYVLKMSI